MTLNEEAQVRVVINERADEIVRRFGNLPATEEIGIVNVSPRRERLGGPNSRFWKCSIEYRIGGEHSTNSLNTINFYVESSSRGKDEQKIGDEEMSIKHDTYRLFKESGITPDVFRLNGLPRTIFMTSVGMRTLEDKTGLKFGNKRVFDSNQRTQFYHAGVDLLRAFHDIAERRIPVLMSGEYFRLVHLLDRRRKQDTGMKLTGKFRRFLSSECDSGAGEFSRLIEPVARMIDSHKIYLIHGDAGAQNFVGPNWYKNGDDEPDEQEAKRVWSAKDMKLIDLYDLRWGHDMQDIGRLATSLPLELTPDEWNSGIEQYLSGDRDRIWKKPVARSFFGSQREVQQELSENQIVKDIYTMFYASAIESSISRRFSLENVRRGEPDKYNAMLFERPVLMNSEGYNGINLIMAVEYVAGKKDLFSWNDEEVDRLKKLESFLINCGVIPNVLPSCSSSKTSQ